MEPLLFAVRVSSAKNTAMFTGIVEEVGRLLWIRAIERGTELQILAPTLADKVTIGESVAVNGCCLTVTGQRSGHISFDLLDETLDRTNLKTLRRDSPVNLERALAANGRIGGHFVQGHIDCTAPAISVEQIRADLRLEIAVPAEFAHYVSYKGSIAINGVSFTIAENSSQSFSVWVIPHTRHRTNLGLIKASELVNLEFDILAKYVERMLGRCVPQD
jgi:riboflavin synthase